MKQLSFHKYQGTGNDFVLVDGRDHPRASALSVAQVQRICDRHLGVGADGYIVLMEEGGYDFRMDYFNADGKQGSMCGNGGRCAVAFAYSLGWVGTRCRFLAYDGTHQARVDEALNRIELQLRPVGDIRAGGGYYFMDTGSPHHVCFVDRLAEVDVELQGRPLRYHERYAPGGVNVNFVEKRPGGIAVATFERGVEAETLSCGTGVTASAIAYLLDEKREEGPVRVSTRGGDLEVRTRQEGAVFTDIWLCGPATKVFEGQIDITD